MRLSILPILLAGASVASLVAAEPIRVVETPSNANANIRLGHALANANVNGNDDNVARVVHPVALVSSPLPDKDKVFGHHFCGASLREKALRLANTIRHALGMPLIATDAELPRLNQVHIVHAVYPAPNVDVHPQEEVSEEGNHRKHHDHDHDHERPNHPHRGHHEHHGHHHKHHKSFLKRIHRAIKSLGPWEGRAVAFVLGCGIGVLLRMFWVLSVLAYRTVRGEREETLDREYFVYGQVPETLFVAPPTYSDEKGGVEAHKDEERK